MKLQELNQNELTEINGGGLLGTGGIQGNLIGPVTIGGLLSLVVNENGVGATISTSGLSSLTGLLSGGMGNMLNLGGLLSGL